MRNLRVTSHVRHTLDLQNTPKDERTTHIRAICVDAQDSNLYASTSSSSLTSSTLVDVDLWQVSPGQRHLSSFSTPRSRGGSSSSSSNQSDSQQVVSFHHLSDGGSFVSNDPALCVVCAGGDIALLAVNDDNEDEEPILPEIVGSVEQGILAASWSPDEELLILITAPTPADLAEDGRPKGSTLLIMTRDFEVLSEEVLQTDDFGEERPITVGWGSKSTQFHGSEGKQAAEAAAALAESEESASRGPVVEDDDLLPHVSWRGDSNIFAVSSVETTASSTHRLIRAFSKTGSLLATSDPSAKGVTHALAFKPTGILMATTQRSPGGHQLSFFERNGLPKGGFSLRDDKARVHQVAWNCDGTLLAIWLDRRIQIWTTGNYHWYLKQEISADSSVTCMCWHTEQPLDFFVATTRSVFSYTFLQQSCVSLSRAPNDAACAAVLDGNRILLTPFRIQNVPPPMSSMQISLPTPHIPIDMAWTDASTSPQESCSVLAVLLPRGSVLCYTFNWGKLGGKVSTGGRPIPTPKLACRFDFGLPARQIAVAGAMKSGSLRLALGVLASEGFESLKVADGRVDAEECLLRRVSIQSLSLGKAAKRVLVHSPASKADHDLIGRIFVHEAKRLRNTSDQELTLPDFFPQISMLLCESAGLQVVGLTSNGRFYHNSTLLAKDATSFGLTDNNIVWTNAAHEARFLPVSSLRKTADLDAAAEIVSLGRRVERGSRIVTTIPSSMSLVLQMPRGNLETICPRPLVLEVIRRLLDAKRFGVAYRICRTHRLDMNLLVDYNPASFLESVPLFVKQVHDAEYLNLFLSSLRQDDVTKTLYKPLGVDVVDATKKDDTNGVNKVNTICDAVRAELESASSDTSSQYLTTILTTHVRKSPPDYESALQLLQKLKNEDASMADDACKYIIFLTNANKLFDAALGMYDFALPLLIAHHSPRKDPREYLPFLRELRDVQPVEMQRFRIDETLGRWSKALGWIAKAGDEHFDKALRFLVAHELYPDGLQIYRSNLHLHLVQESYGEWLLEKGRYKEAAILFALGGKHRKAIEANVKAGSWKEAFEIAATQNIAKLEMHALAKRVAAVLGSYGRNAEAAIVAVDYLQDVEEAVTFLCKGLEYSEAKRVAALHDRMDLLETHIRPSLLETSDSLMEEIAEMADQGQKQFVRLAELRKKKLENPDDFHPEVDIDVDPIDGDDAFSQAFTTFTRFTRYTAFTRQGGAPGSAMSGFTMNSKRTRKSKRKDAKKQQTGKKGTIYEEDYLFESVQKLLETRLGRVQGDVGKVLLQFARLGGSSQSGGTLADKYRKKASDLYSALSAFEKNMQEEADVVWTETKKEEEEMEKQRLRAIEEATALGVSWAQLQANGLFAAQIERKRITVAKGDWQLELLPQL